MQTYEENIKRFFNKLNKTDSCWFWLGNKNENGYGYFKFKNKVQRTHRVSWMIHIGKIPTKMCVLHKCDNRGCVNPNHLFLGTQKDNVMDMIKKGRAFILRMHGENHPNSKLTLKKVQTIRRLKQNGRVSVSVLANKYNVNKQTIYSVLQNRNWKIA